MKKITDLTGERFGRLIVKSRVEKPQDRIGSGTYWLCLCDCGNEKVTTGRLLKRGRTKSCGCLYSERKETLRTHGMSRGEDGKHTPLYGRWANIKDRCCNPNSKDYCKYGGRGITVCDEWINNYKAFYDWAIKNEYSQGLQLDRRDNSKGYSPENCRWVTPKTNSNNRRDNIKVTAFGMEKTILEWSEKTKIPYRTLWKQVKENNLEEYIIRRLGKEVFQDE